MKILIVDDKEEALYLLETMLKQAGNEVVSARNGLEALEQLRGKEIHIIISDILMPKMDGFQLCRAVKSDVNMQSVPFVFYTASFTDPRDEELAFKCGADRYIRKPVDPDIFISMIHATARDLKAGEPKPGIPQEEEETEILKLYNERLIRKLEQKMFALEREIAERKKAEKFLKESQTQLRLAVKASNIGLWDWNLLTNEVYFSPEWKNQIGYEDNEIPNRYEEWEHRLHPEDRNSILATLNECLKPPYPLYKVEFRFRHKNGSYRWIYVRGEVLRDENDKPVRMVGCHIDITERKKTEEEIQQRVKDLEDFYKMAIGRELRMKELKEEIAEIKEKLAECTGGKSKEEDE